MRSDGRGSCRACVRDSVGTRIQVCNKGKMDYLAATSMGTGPGITEYCERVGTGRLSRNAVEAHIATLGDALRRNRLGLDSGDTDRKGVQLRRFLIQCTRQMCCKLRRVHAIPVYLTDSSDVCVQGDSIVGELPGGAACICSMRCVELAACDELIAWRPRNPSLAMSGGHPKRDERELHAVWLQGRCDSACLCSKAIRGLLESLPL